MTAGTQIRRLKAPLHGWWPVDEPVETVHSHQIAAVIAAANHAVTRVHCPARRASMVRVKGTFSA
jgi:hypothetical protein